MAGGMPVQLAVACSTRLLQHRWTASEAFAEALEAPADECVPLGATALPVSRVQVDKWN